MTLEKIKEAVTSGKTVHWCNDGYSVMRDSAGRWLIVYRFKGHCIGLTWRDGVTLNGEESEFYLAP